MRERTDVRWNARSRADGNNAHPQQANKGMYYKGEQYAEAAQSAHNDPQSN
jgi:hypothetical protein